ncbi:BTB/POZ domain-containing protein 18 [Ochotona curzoniae]|uniref:BTB/POZ domain-containing protein 18 n=1 Tax=Ochotona curzoniae TaxID=130825 RepID=UPI001B34FA83|nr:BTB/POZ domain-containing protein 18 [Ochotona curzoniae]
MFSAASPKILYRNPRFLRLAFLQLHHQQQSGVFCDVLLQAEGEAVPAHCCILSACSPFFTERLERERPAQGRKVVLELGGLKIKTLRKLVDFLYTAEMEVSQEEAQDILSAARQLQVSELESLQLEGEKLVKVPQGRRLNRECLQLPSAAPISARVVVPSRRPRTPLPVGQTPCPLGAVRLKSSGKEDGAQEKSHWQNTESSATTLLKKKARVCPAPAASSSSPPSHSQGPKEDRNDPALGPAVLSSPSSYPSVDERLLPRKIRLSRSKPPPDVSTAKPSDIPSGPSPVPAAPGRRLWRQRSINKEAPGDKQKPGKASPSQNTPSPSGLGKTGGNKKRSPEVRAPVPDSAEEGQVGRVKLRKIVNGTCWEVVQEPPHKNSLDKPQTPDPGDSLEEPPGTKAASVNEQEMPSAEREVCQGSPVCSTLPDILLSASPSSDQPVVKSEGELGSSSELTEKESTLLDMDGREAYVFDTALLEQPCEAEEYRITSAAATSELEEILDFMLCDSHMQPPLGSLASPEAEGCRTPSYHFTGPGKDWIEGEEWCLPEMELWPTELDKDTINDKESVESLSPLVMPSELSAAQVLSAEGPWTPDLDMNSSQPLSGQGDKLLQVDSPRKSSGDLSPPCTDWVEMGLEVPLTVDEVLNSAPEPGKEAAGNPELPGCLSPSSEEIDVVDWPAEGQLVPGIPSVWPDPSSESETEVDILT